MEVKILKWENVLSEIKRLSDDSEFALISTYVAKRSMIENILDCSKKFQDQMVMFLGVTEGFLFPYEPQYRVIPKQQLQIIDPERNLHSKIFLFGKREQNGIFLKCLIGSCNATVSGVLKNIEFWASSQGFLEMPLENDDSLIDTIFRDDVDPSLIAFDDCVKEENKIIGPTLDLLWRLVRNSKGFSAGLEKGRGDSFSDRLMKTELEKSNALFVHTLGDNSLRKSIEEMLSLIDKAKQESEVFIVSPYHNWKMVNTIIKLCLSKLSNFDKKLKIKFLTNFPPDFQDRYLSKQSFGKIEKTKIDDERIEFCLKVWTKNSTIRTSEVLNNQGLKDISGVFLHGKIITVTNDQEECQALVGSANLTEAAMSETPKNNLETGVWERDQNRAMSIHKEIQYLWNAAETLTDEKRKRLGEWHKEKNEEKIQSNTWIDGQELIKEYVNVQILKNNSLLDGKNIHFDELDNIIILIKILEGAPQINASEIRCIFYPNLDNFRSWEQKANVGSDKKVSIELSNEIKKNEACKLFYKTIIPTRIVKEITLPIKRKTNDNVTINSPLFYAPRYDLAVLVKTSKGWKEFSDIKKVKSKLIINTAQNVITSNKVKLRIYLKNEEINYTTGWDFITITKRRPKIEAKLSCVCDSSLCFKLQETRKKTDAIIYPEKMEVSFQGLDEKPEVHLIHKIADCPYQAQHYFKFNSNNPFLSNRTNEDSKILINLRFKDENSKLRKMSELYQELFCNPKMKNSNECILQQQAEGLLNLAKKVTIVTSPEGAKILEKAPIEFDIKIPEDVDQKFLKNIKSITMYWCLIHWGRRREGKIIDQQITFPSCKITITPDQIAEALDVPEKSLNFKGLLKTKFLFKLDQGWEIPIQDVDLVINETDEFFSKTFENEWLWKNVKKYIKDKNSLAEKIVQTYFEVISEKKPRVAQNISEFETKLRWGFDGERGSFGHIGKRVHGFEMDQKITRKTIKLIANMIAENVKNSFLSDKKNPKLSFDLLLGRLERQIIKDMTKKSRLTGGKTALFPNIVLEDIGIETRFYSL